MKILIVGLNYPPESTSIGPYTADLAMHLHEAGHEVRVSTGFPAAPQWKIPDEYKGHLRMEETLNGIPVRRSYLYIPDKPQRAVQRMLFDCSFACSALLVNLFGPRADLVVVISPPLQLGLAGWLLSILYNAPCFFHIQDLVPDAAIVLGVLREDQWLVRFARLLEKFIYRRMIGIGVISPGFRTNLIAKGISPDKVALLPNYIDPQFIQPGKTENAFRAAHNIARHVFLVMYSGSVGLKQGLETLVEAAAELQSYKDVLICIVGEGPSRNDLISLGQKLMLNNLRFLPLQPRASLSDQLTAADVLVITQRKSVTDVVFPGKLLYYMASARPILAAASSDSETGRFIEENRVGLVVPPENPRSLANAILRLKSNPAEGLALGENGRQICVEQFDRSIVLKCFTDYLENLQRQSGKQPVKAVAAKAGR